MAKPTGAHPDGIQADGEFDDLKIIHNTVVNELGDNASLMLSNYWGPINGVVIDHNAFLGGGYTVYFNEMGSQPAGGGGPITNLSIMSEGGWGYMSVRTNLGHVPVISGNVDNATGALLAVNNAAPGTGTPTIPSGVAAPDIASWSSDTGVAGDGVASDNTRIEGYRCRQQHHQDLRWLNPDRYSNRQLHGELGLHRIGSDQREACADRDRDQRERSDQCQVRCGDRDGGYGGTGYPGPEQQLHCQCQSGQAVRDSGG